MIRPHYTRYSHKNVETALSDTPVVFITGPRQSGKTTLVKAILAKDKNWKYLNLDDQAQLAIAKQDPIGFIRNLSSNHIAIDEIQRLPELLLAIKQAVDENRAPGRFLLTGSSNALLLPQVLDSLAGRIESIALNPLSECEINNIQPSFLTKLIDGQAPLSKTSRIRPYLLKRITTGCFPEALQRTSSKRIKAWYSQYIHSLIQKDIKELAHIDHPDKMLKLLKITSYYSGKLVNFSELGDQVGLNKTTTKKYVSLLEQLFLLKQLPAWHTNYYKRLVKTSKLFLADTGLICAIRNINSDYLTNHPEEIGPLLETFIICELQKQATWCEDDYQFYHYRDKDKVEVDCIIENSGGNCFAIEIKASATLTSKDFHGLERFKDIAKKRFKLGILLYDGDHTTAFANDLF